MNILRLNALFCIFFFVLGLTGCSPMQSSTLIMPPNSFSSPTKTQTITATPIPTQLSLPTEAPLPTLTLTPAPTLPLGIENSVRVDFINSTVFTTSSQQFTNHEVSGVSHWNTTFTNKPDQSQAPVYGLGLTYLSELDRIGSNIRQQFLIKAEHPNYAWFMGDVPEETVQDVYKSEAYIESAEGSNNPFTPGFDASITTDTQSFTEPGTQTVTITITPRQQLTFAGITVHVNGGPHSNVADAEISSLSPGEHKGKFGEQISLSPDKKNLFINQLPLELYKQYNYSFTIKVVPISPNTNYRPYVSIGWLPSPDPSGNIQVDGTIKGNSLEHHIDNMGTWKWSANGIYTWNWHEGMGYYVNFEN
jgi:hypothetical protein